MYNDYLLQSGCLLLVGLIIAWWAHYKRLFSSMHNPDFAGAPHPTYNQVRWYHVVIGFVTLIFVQICLISLPIYFFPILQSSVLTIGWLIAIVNLIFALFLVFYLKRENLLSIFYVDKLYLKEGFYTLIVALPWVLLASTVSQFFVQEVLKAPPVQQNPVAFLESFDLNSFVYYLVSISIFTTIPFNEEILFRGLFQNFITKYLSKWGGLLMTPLFFALVHYQWGQGVSNIELLSPLLIPAFFLSYLYQKSGSLVSCIVFHTSFNFINLVGLTLYKLTSE